MPGRPKLLGPGRRPGLLRHAGPCSKPRQRSWTQRDRSGTYSRRSCPSRRFMAALLSSTPSKTDGRRPSAPGPSSCHRRPSVMLRCVRMTISASRGNARWCRSPNL
eukprot:3479171-Rhodomonas_salina.1